MKPNNKYNFLFVIFGLLLIADIAYSSYHYSNLPIDGDLGRIVAPIRWYQDVMDDPLGITAISTNTKYGGAGRFSCHYITQWWFTHVHSFLGVFIKNPVTQLYATSTAFTFLLHCLFLLLVFMYAKGKEKFSWKGLVFLSFVATSFIQYNSYYDCIGIIDRSINYCFFYALPLFVLLLYFYPYYKYYYSGDNKSLPIYWHVILLITAPLLAFSGPLVQPVVFILFVFFIGGTFIPNPYFKLPKSRWVGLQFIYLLTFCLYAYYVSKFNVEADESVGLIERYKLLGKGVFHILTLKPAWLFIVIGIVFQSYLALKYKVIEKTKLKSIFLFVILFSGVYLLLLPLGGFRSYRPLIVRYDTLLPVTLCFIYLFTYLAYHLFLFFSGKLKWIHLSFLGLFWLVFFLADKNLEKEANYCQQGVFYKILENDEQVIKETASCNVLTWSTGEFQDQEQMIAINKCLLLWGFIEKNQRVELTEVK